MRRDDPNNPGFEISDEGWTPAPHLVRPPSLASRIAALPIRGLDWLLRKAIR